MNYLIILLFYFELIIYSILYKIFNVIFSKNLELCPLDFSAIRKLRILVIINPNVTISSN